MSGHAFPAVIASSVEVGLAFYARFDVGPTVCRSQCYDHIRANYSDTNECV